MLRLTEIQNEISLLGPVELLQATRKEFACFMESETVGFDTLRLAALIEASLDLPPEHSIVGTEEFDNYSMVIGALCLSAEALEMVKAVSEKQPAKAIHYLGEFEDTRGMFFGIMREVTDNILRGDL